MAKLLEKNGAEMAAALVSLAAPIKSFMNDPEFDAAFKEATKKGMETQMTDVLSIYSNLIPLLLGKNHLNDTMTILAVVEGKSVKELLKMNGTDLLADMIKAFTEQIKPFFQRLGVSVGVQL